MVRTTKEQNLSLGTLKEIISESDKRYSSLLAERNPITGLREPLKRTKISLPDFPIPVQYLPDNMLREPLVHKIISAGSIKGFITSCLKLECNDENITATVDAFTRVRFRYDFCFWAACLIWIHPKNGGEDVLFHLNNPQCILLEEYEKLRIAGKPIRVILLKARQFGGSTLTQMYFAWLQLVHKKGLNSLIVSHVLSSSYTILDMYSKMLEKYPTEYLYPLGDTFKSNEQKWVGVGNSGSIHEIPARSCKIKVGTAIQPDNDRSGNYALVHLSEVGLWKKTEGKSPEDIVQGATSGVLLMPYTAIVIESTAKGTGNYFHREYTAAKEGKSQFTSVFIPWFNVENNSIPFEGEKEKKEFATTLYLNRKNRNAMSDRDEPGVFLWRLWEKGASLEAIHWYVLERKKFNDHGRMASEYPSDDIEAFVHSGNRVFDQYQIDKFRPACRAPRYVGDVYADETEGDGALSNIKFSEDRQGLLWVWEKPDIDPTEIISDRYLVVVDIGGRSAKADWSVIVVFDRLFMKDGDKPVVVAQWYGHIDMDLLAWKSAQIASWYDDALLVIESNTLETHDTSRQVDGDQSLYILDQIKSVYPNLYSRPASESSRIKDGVDTVYGFHTNALTKPVIISELTKVIRNTLYVERDQRCLDEYITYERKQNGSFGAIDGCHDDLLMTRAIGLYICLCKMELPVVRERDELNITRRKAVSEASF